MPCTLCVRSDADQWQWLDDLMDDYWLRCALDRDAASVPICVTRPPAELECSLSAMESHQQENYSDEGHDGAIHGANATQVVSAEVQADDAADEEDKRNPIHEGMKTGETDAQVILLPLVLWRFKTGLASMSIDSIKRMCAEGGYYCPSENRVYKVAWPCF